MILRNVSLPRACTYILSAILYLFWAFNAAAQNPQSRITQPVIESQRVTLAGHVHPLAKPKYDQGALEDSVPAGRILMLLSRTEAQQAALDKLLEEQQTPGSANYHHWLTPEEFGAKFGASDADVQKVTGWLASQGFSVGRVAASKMVIEFSGTAGQVKNALHTELHRYALPNGTYTANNADPQIPTALAPVVRGFVSLNNFPRHSYARVHGTAIRTHAGAIRPQWTDATDGFFAIGPGDFAVIYNSMPLIQSKINGAGTTIGIVGQSNISLTDVANFRSLFGLPASTPTVVVDGADPGLVTSGDEGEAVMDVEWAGATAPGATIKLVVAQSVDLAAQYLVDNNLADILSESYGACEPELLTAGNTLYKNVWQQAAGQGITVLVAAGDSGSAGCEDPNSTSYSENNLGGVAVSGIASTPYNVAVGGTDFNDASSTSTYWGANYNDNTSGEKNISALGYIPEMTWNDSCAHAATASSLTTCANVTSTDSNTYGTLQLWAGSGGPSNCATSTLDKNNNITCTAGYSKPSWQTGPGVPSDGVRDTPDVALFAATGISGSNSFYVACQADYSGSSCVPDNQGQVPFVGVSGTSAATPNFAAIVALAEQQIGNQRLGNINYLLYKIAAQSGNSCASSAPTSSCVFHDTQVGNISVPCASGSPDCSVASGTPKGVLVANNAPAYMTTAGYDTATGLGTVNVNNLVAAIANMAVPTISTPSATSTILVLGNSTTLSVTVTGNSSLGAPTGTITFKDGSTSIGTATSTSTSGNTLSGSRSFAPTASGTHTITATISAGGGYVAATSSTLTVTVNSVFTQSLSSSAINVGSSGGSGTNTITFTPGSGSGTAMTISYYCSSSSTAASCSPTSSAPGSVSISNAAVTANINYTVPALAASAKPAQRTTPWKLGGGVLFAGVILFAVPGIRRRGQFALMLLLLSAAGIATSCGGGGSSTNSAAPQTYTFTVTSTTTAYGATATQTSTFTVTN